MLLRPYLVLYRGRLTTAAVVALLVVIATVMMLGWNWCGCPPGADDGYNARLSVMLSFDIAGGLLAIVLGLAIPLRTPGAPNEARFLLTRPLSRIAIQFYPLAISVAAIALLPLLSWVVVVVCLWALHTHSFTELAALAKLVAATSALGAEPSFLRMLFELDLGRSYLATMSVGLTLYAPLAGQRWFLLSRWKAIQILGAFVIFMLIPLFMTLAPFIIEGSSFVAWVLLLPMKQGGLTYLPSNTGIALHLFFAAAWICGTFFVLREIEA